ncbi:dihydrolipoamide acetyltransferase family protein [Halorientalis halophila]|uniref:dihydrolipoamide acetyltransferase family protein n=1 Tax=Halorientalis halophila TaxID=3108499 RepID=UPI00300965AF
MTVEFVLPDVGEGLTEAEIVQWLVGPGEAVSEDQPIVEVETDKAVVEVPAPVTGSVQELHAEAGEVVPVGEVIVTFATDAGPADAADEADETDEAADAADPSGGSEADGEGHENDESETADGRMIAPPRVRRLARELGVDLGSVANSSAGRRITEGDVRAAAGTDDTNQGDDGVADDTVSASDDTAAPTTAGVASQGAPANAEQAGTADTRPASGATPADREQTLAVPATRGLARELDVDLNRVPMVEERNGEAFVSAEAVREFAASGEPDRTGERVTTSEPGSGSAGGTTATPSPDAGPTAGERVPYEGVRRTIGERMTESKFTVPHVTHHDEVDVTELVAVRDRLRERAAERGVDLTYMPLILKAVVAALQEFPRFNARLDEDAAEIVMLEDYDIGVATATDAGLMVPVVEAVDEKSVLEIARTTTDLVERARDRTIDLDDLQGGTFTVTNFGAVGGEYGTPIVNYPEAAILGIGAIKKKPRVVESDEPADDGVSGEVVPRHVLTLSLSFDHRIADGADAARFVNAVKTYLRDPDLLLLE